MQHRLTYEYVKNFVDKENTLISKEYINNRKLLEILCKKCNKIYLQCFGNYGRGHRCRSCSMSENGKKGAKKRYGGRTPLKETNRICVFCKNNFVPKLSKQKLCNKECADNFLKTDETKKINAKIHGSKGGVASAASQQRRSKNEILFANLCINYFGEEDIQCNEQIFKDKNGNLWDSDIFIKTSKTAILWDGFYYHYSEHASNKQKARDKLKRKIILDNNCIYYTIIDKGGFNPKFVREQFDLFIHKLQFKNVLDSVKQTTS